MSKQHDNHDHGHTAQAHGKDSSKLAPADICDLHTNCLLSRPRVTVTSIVCMTVLGCSNSLDMHSCSVSQALLNL